MIVSQTKKNGIYYFRYGKSTNEKKFERAAFKR